MVAGNFALNHTAVKLFNHGASSITATDVNAYGMGCAWTATAPTIAAL